MQKAQPPEPDPFLVMVAGARDYVRHVIKVASWKLTLAATFAVLGRLAWPLVPDESVVQGLVMLAATSLGACIGREIDHNLQKRKRGAS